MDEQQFTMASFECACVDGNLPKVKNIIDENLYISQNSDYINSQIKCVKKQIDIIHKIDLDNKHPIRNTEYLDNVIVFLENKLKIDRI